MDSSEKFPDKFNFYSESISSGSYNYGEFNSSYYLGVITSS